MNMHISKQFVLGLLTTAILAGGVYLVINQTRTDNPSADEQKQTQNSAQWGSGDISLESGSTNQQVTPTQESTSTDRQVQFDNPKTFTHDKRRFSFQYPQNFRVGRFDQGDTEIIVVQNPNKQVGFQVSIRPIDEQIAMTKKRIKQDLPDLQVRQPQPVQLGANAGQGLAFYSDNEAFGGNSREVWFTFSDHLYQISTYANLDPLLKQVLNSWTFR